MQRHWQDGINAAVGLWIFLSPWIMPHVMAGPDAPRAIGIDGMWTLYVIGAAIAVVAIAAFLAFRAWEEWVNVTLGLWLMTSPWLHGFSGATVLMGNAATSGALVIILALSVLRSEGRLLR